jgi:DNA-binding response OmpR family regulator
MNILIADDDRVTTTAIAGRLKAAGYQTMVAFDAMQVGMMVMKNSPDAVLLDVNMPGGSGIQALQRIKASNKTTHIPVIVLTASVDPDLPKKVREMGADAFLTKPVDFQKLEELLKQLTHGGPDTAKGSSPKP